MVPSACYLRDGRQRKARDDLPAHPAPLPRRSRSWNPRPARRRGSDGARGARSSRPALDRFVGDHGRALAPVPPFIGLFGTVWGIMNAFRSIGAAGAASIAAYAPGIAEALVTTAAGLAAAIPAVAGYNYFVARLRHLDEEMEDFAADLVQRL